jgi:hypothetical protein
MHVTCSARGCTSSCARQSHGSQRLFMIRLRGLGLRGRGTIARWRPEIRSTPKAIFLGCCPRENRLRGAPQLPSVEHHAGLSNAPAAVRDEVVGGYRRCLLRAPPRAPGYRYATETALTKTAADPAGGVPDPRYYPLGCVRCGPNHVAVDANRTDRGDGLVHPLHRRVAADPGIDEGGRSGRDDVSGVPPAAGTGELAGLRRVAPSRHPASGLHRP